MRVNLRAISIAAVLGTVAFGGILTACGKKDTVQAGAEQQMPPTVVEVQVVALGHIPVMQSFSGRVTAIETSEVRPQVGGIVSEVLFKEGSTVSKGQELYRINRDNYISAANTSAAAIDTAQASLVSAKASLVAQEATLAQARSDLARAESLVGIDAISKQLHQQYQTAVKTASANVEAARATVNQAQSAINSARAVHDASLLDMSRTVVRAPISGKIGISAVTAGALVSASQQTPLATISRTDTVYVDISQSSSEMLKLRQQIASGEAQQGTTQVQIVLEDGEVYPLIGQLALSNTSVDEATGAVTIRAVFPNPDGLLIPGMYVNANLAQSVVANAVLLPQTAVMRTPQGATQVYVVNADNKIEVREVKTAGTFDGKWVVNGGLNDGDKVVVMGGAKVKPEQAVEVKIVGAESSRTQTPAPTQGQSQGDVAGNSTQAGQNTVLAPQKPQESATESKTPTQAPTQDVSTPTQAPSTPSSSEHNEAMSMADGADK